MKIAMIGTGYVGLVSGVCFSDFGHEVVCVDKDPSKIEKLEKGIVPIYEPGLDDLMAKNVAAGRLSFTGDLASAVDGADAVFIAVGTPTRRGDGHADLTYVMAAAEEIASVLTGYAVIVTKSTVPVGTNRQVKQVVAKANPKAEFDVASNPEFLREGFAVEDLMNPDRKNRLQLYVKRVFITDDCDDLMPAYLRFVRGIVDSEDLPLNVSREMLQHNVVVKRIRSALIRRVFNELQKKAEKAPEEFSKFWDNFGALLKEGLYEDHENRDKILEIVRFNSTASDELISLAEYVERMKKGQTEIYYISGEGLDLVKASPQLEGFKARGIEVLLMTDPVDEFWLPMVGQFDEKPFTSATSGSVDLSKIKNVKDKKADDDKNDATKADDASVAKLILALKESLGETVKDVCSSDRLTDSAVCLVAGEGDMDLHLERMLKMQGQMEVPTAARVLEINPAHPLIIKMSEVVNKPAKKTALNDMALLLFDQARIIEGEPVSDPTAFSQRLNSILEQGL